MDVRLHPEDLPEGWSKAENASDAETEYVVGEFNCSCVGISKFQAVCGGEKTLANVGVCNIGSGVYYVYEPRAVLGAMTVARGMCVLFSRSVFRLLSIVERVLTL